jgi:hypothetical protein
MSTQHRFSRPFRISTFDPPDLYSRMAGALNPVRQKRSPGSSENGSGSEAFPKAARTLPHNAPQSEPNPSVPGASHRTSNNATPNEPNLDTH